MKVLVFGRTGQVARALIDRGPGRGIAVAALGRDAADLSDPAACAARIARTDADAVVNAAAWTAVDAAEADEDAARIVNADAPAAMARACAARDLPFVHISTDYVFAGTGTDPWRPDDATAPVNAYGRTKRAGEQGVLEAGGRAVVLRTSWVFSGQGANFLTTMLRLARTRDALDVVEDQVGGPTPAPAIADACLTIADRLVRREGQGGIHHLSGAPDVSWADFARAIFAVSGDRVAVTGIPTAAWPTPAPRPANSRLDCSGLAAAFGIGRPDWRAVLPSMIEDARCAHARD
ncbi:hypothetical protein OCGS_2629 [Oceaniovalibus guishaninsula JLT2003]|uniref:dTDP-4-dehydrorhamnose reductase n=1 Tax=Oceaniovalibus guishaninsula JLT2003 TaxID=1231392 RepID=K2H9K0_9RHOB|nr:dTDP-4-dehydrorhamnose reductase [Oceaniovalibus guishaninsula]EKE43292.1 hypothetical protein OCGS_2629 [Oceaniovalibus guishaninsula JLT2003]